LVKTLLSIRIRIDGCRTHRRPHVHVDYVDNHHAASFAIDTGERLAGGLNRKYDRAVREWVGRNRTLLMEAWRQVRNSENTDEIVAALRKAA
jgi:hypothetical protein